MNGQIATLIASPVPADKQTVADVFGASFQTMGDWRAYLRITLGGNVTTMLGARTSRWSVRSFQAMFVACWIHHPVEKGTYMIDLVGMSKPQLDVIAGAYEKHLKGRKSSHLSGSGRSASKGFNFLNGYQELLVQMETTRGRPFLLLKAEGHTTGISGVVPHLQSWAHKRKHGVGLMASPALNTLATANPLLEERAAENYAKHYKKLLKDVLGFSGKQVTVREAMQKLFQVTSYPAPANFHMSMKNDALGMLLTQYCNAATTVGAQGVRYRADGKITGDMIADLRSIAGTLNADGDHHLVRVFREIRVKPGEVDASLDTFYGMPG